ncbi:NAD(P)H-hydrate dehydratase [Flavobacteriaceae bacterium R38]|nr:NAD(P)H-hydrate dehydratase [Flavobacteriaceae bacterium R38]
MKIFSANQIYEADKFTIKKQEITSYELMERSGTVIFDWIHTRLQGAQVKIHVFCGIGNNGGDGLVVSRHLVTHGYNVETYILNFSDNHSKDFLKNLDKIKDLKHWPSLINCVDDFPEINKEDIVVDAIFGIGLNRRPEVCTTDLIRHINKSEAFTLAVDVPSGMHMDQEPESEDLVVHANYVLTLQSPKLPFFLPQTGIYINDWEVLDIGIDQEYIQQTAVETYLIEKQEILQVYTPRAKFSHKGSYGHSLIIGGSYGKIGAALLASKACLNTGAGLVTSYTPKCGYSIIQTAFPEGMVVTDAEENYISKIDFEISPSVIGMGMGMGMHDKTVKAFKDFLEANKKPLVLDADAINILAENESLLEKVPPQTILTPHPGELKRLIGQWKDDFDKIKMAKAFAKKYDVILIIKGAHSMVIYDGKAYINNTGNPGMATAGSGDVLAGIITGFISQGYEQLTSAIFGVYLQGKAGDLAILKTGYQALTASRLIDYIGDAFIDLFKQELPANREEGEGSNP